MIVVKYIMIIQKCKAFLSTWILADHPNALYAIHLHSDVIRKHTCGL